MKLPTAFLVAVQVIEVIRLFADGCAVRGRHPLLDVVIDSDELREVLVCVRE